MCVVGKRMLGGQTCLASPKSGDHTSYKSGPVNRNRTTMSSWCLISADVAVVHHHCVDMMVRMSDIFLNGWVACMDREPGQLAGAVLPW
jgi:hypothetical protein